MNRRYVTQELRRSRFAAQGSHDRRPLISPHRIGHVVTDACGNGRGRGGDLS
jgi:hypothetical protein